MKMVTRAAIEYHAAPYGFVAMIPAGTPVAPAANLPSGGSIQWWAEPWADMSESAEAWMRGYGFGLADHEVAGTPLPLA